MVGSRNDRKLKKYSDKFNKMFDFYLKIQRSGLITFCGSNFVVDHDQNGSDAKFAFREYDNGRFKFINPKSRHPNILKAVITGKKGWGLWVNEWTDGITECSFTKYEILKQFEDKGIVIPECLKKEFEDRLWKKRFVLMEKRNLKRFTDME